MVSPGGDHTVLLRSDGTAVAIGRNVDGRCSIPPLDRGITYMQLSAGYDHTVLLRSDGIVVVAIGSNDHGQCNIPSLDEGMTYTQVAAGFQNSVLLRVMAALLLLVRMIRDNATSRLWMRE
jgi:alpha-tubulin suppressor-like RCC1 family protein